MRIEHPAHHSWRTTRATCRGVGRAGRIAISSNMFRLSTILLRNCFDRGPRSRRVTRRRCFISTTVVSSSYHTAKIRRGRLQRRFRMQLPLMKLAVGDAFRITRPSGTLHIRAPDSKRSFSVSKLILRTSRLACVCRPSPHPRLPARPCTTPVRLRGPLPIRSITVVEDGLTIDRAKLARSL